MLKLKGAFNRVLTQIDMESQAAILRVRAPLERVDSEALRNAATCLAIFHDCVAEVCRSMAGTTDAVAGFDESVAVV